MSADDASPDSGEHRMGWNATFSMAVGGMIGGGIFSVLGVVVSIAGPWAWASFAIGGVIACLTALSYVRLAASFARACARRSPPTDLLPVLWWLRPGIGCP